MTNERILIDHHIMGGVPCVRGTRIPAATILDLMAEGASTSEVLEYHPQLVLADVLASFEYAPSAVDDRHLPIKLPV